jgi:DNA-binding CsgD family transcriptional regulator
MKLMMLSPLEKTCLQWISRGRTVAEIALLEGKSVGDIESYLQSAMVALDAKSIAQALRKMNLSD